MGSLRTRIGERGRAPAEEGGEGETWCCVLWAFIPCLPTLNPPLGIPPSPPFPTLQASPLLASPPSLPFRLPPSYDGDTASLLGALDVFGLDPPAAAASASASAPGPGTAGGWQVEAHTPLKAYHITLEQFKALPESMQKVGEASHSTHPAPQPFHSTHAPSLLPPGLGD